MSTCCDDCGDDARTCFCEKCREKYHEHECDSCERVNLDDGDYGYCPACERSDCDGCERGNCSTCDHYSAEDYDGEVERRSELVEYSNYLEAKLDTAGVFHLSLAEFLEEEDSNKAAEAMHANPEEDDPSELERRLNDAAEKRKAASNFSNE